MQSMKELFLQINNGFISFKSVNYVLLLYRLEFHTNNILTLCKLPKEYDTQPIQLQLQVIINYSYIASYVP